MWLLRIKNLSKDEVLDLFDEGAEYESVRGEVHVQYYLKKHLLDDLNNAKKHSLKPIKYAIEKVNYK